MRVCVCVCMRAYVSVCVSVCLRAWYPSTSNRSSNLDTCSFHPSDHLKTLGYMLPFPRAASHLKVSSDTYKGLIREIMTDLKVSLESDMLLSILLSPEGLIRE